MWTCHGWKKRKACELMTFERTVRYYILYCFGGAQVIYTPKFGRLVDSVLLHFLKNFCDANSVIMLITFVALLLYHVYHNLVTFDTLKEY